MNYNTERSDIEMREYGRHLQKMIDYAVHIPKREERQKVAEVIIQMMATLNPMLRSTADYKQKLWDHLFIISKFKLDVDSPYQKPTEETARIKPADMPYPQKKIKLRHYGRNVETLVKKASQMENEDKKAIFTEIIGNFMKLAYKNWSNEEVSNDLIKEDMKTLSGGALEISEDMNIESMTRNQPKRNFQPNSYQNKNKNKNKNKNNRPNRGNFPPSNNNSNNNNNRNRFNKNS